MTASLTSPATSAPTPAPVLGGSLLGNPVFVLAYHVQQRLSRLLVGTADTDAVWFAATAAKLEAIAATDHRDADLAARAATIARTAATALRGWS